MSRWLELILTSWLEVHRFLRHWHCLVLIIHELVSSIVLVKVLLRPILERLRRILHSLETVWYVVLTLGFKVESLSTGLEICCSLGGRSEGLGSWLELFVRNFHTTTERILTGLTKRLCSRIRHWLRCWLLLWCRRSDWLLRHLWWHRWSRLLRCDHYRSILDDHRFLRLRLMLSLWLWLSAWSLFHNWLLCWRKIEERVYLLSDALLTSFLHLIKGALVNFCMEGLKFLHGSRLVSEHAVKFIDCLLVESVDSSILLFLICVIFL